MILSDEQIAFISASLERYGVLETELKDDLLDHICTYIEQEATTDFNLALKEALHRFGGHYGLFALQQHTMHHVSVQRSLGRVKGMYIAGFIAAFLISTGSVFKFMHWPTAAVLLMLGFLALNFVFLPLFFYNRYKSETTAYSSIL